MSEFTQGNWEYADCTSEFFSVFNYKTGEGIALVPKKANARVIANAPDMYKFIESAFLTKDSRHLDWDVLVKSAGELLARIDGEEIKHEE